MGAEMSTSSAFIRRGLPAAFMRDFEIVAAHYKFPASERLVALTAARADYARAAECYRAMAASLRPVVKSRFSSGSPRPDQP